MRSHADTFGMAKTKTKPPATKPRTKTSDGGQLPATMGELAGDPRNARTIKDTAAAGLRYSMDQFGDLSGIVFNLGTKQLVAGHQRIDQLRKKHAGVDLSIERLDTERGIIREPDGTTWPVRFVDWPAAKQRAANIAANSGTIAGEFTEEVFLLLGEVKAETPDLYDALLFDGLGKAVEPVEEPLPDAAPPDTRTCTLRWRADQEPAIRGFLNLSESAEMPAQLGVAILGRIESLATGRAD